MAIDDPKAYAKEIKALLAKAEKEQENSLKSLVTENKKNITEIAKLKEQIRVLRGETNKVPKLETKQASLKSEISELKRNQSRLSKAITGIKTQYKKKFDDLKDKKEREQRTPSFSLNKRDITDFNKSAVKSMNGQDKNKLNTELSLFTQELWGQNFRREDSITLGSKIGKKNSLKEQDNVTNNFKKMNEELTKVNQKLNLFGAALLLNKFWDWGTKKHEDTKNNIAGWYRSGLNYQDARSISSISKVFGQDQNALQSSLADWRMRKDLIGAGGTSALSDEESKLLFGVGNGGLQLKGGMDYILQNSAQDSFFGIGFEAAKKIKEEDDKERANPNYKSQASVTLGLLRQSGTFSAFADMIEVARMQGLDYVEVFKKLSETTDTPMGHEERVGQYSLILQESFSRLSNIADRLSEVFMELTAPILELINKLPFMQTGGERVGHRKNVMDKLEKADSLNDVGIYEAGQEISGVGNLLHWVSNKFTNNNTQNKKTLGNMIEESYNLKEYERDKETSVQQMINIANVLSKKSESKEYSDYFRKQSDMYSKLGDKGLANYYEEIANKTILGEEYDLSTKDILDKSYKSTSNAIFNSHLNTLSDTREVENKTKVDVDINVRNAKGIETETSARTDNGSNVSITDNN